MIPVQASGISWLNVDGEVKCVLLPTTSEADTVRDNAVNHLRDWQGGRVQNANANMVVYFSGSAMLIKSQVRCFSCAQA